MSCFAVSKLAGRLKNHKEGSPDSAILAEMNGKNGRVKHHKGSHLPKVEILQEVNKFVKSKVELEK